MPRDPQRRRPWGRALGLGVRGVRQGEGRGPGTWERELVDDAGSTAAELAYAAPERTSGMRNAAEAIHGLPALRIDGACSASPPPPRGPPFCLAPCKVGANSGSPPRAPRPQYGSFLRGALKEESKRSDVRGEGKGRSENKIQNIQTITHSRMVDPFLFLFPICAPLPRYPSFFSLFFKGALKKLPYAAVWEEPELGGRARPQTAAGRSQAAERGGVRREAARARGVGRQRIFSAARAAPLR